MDLIIAVGTKSALKIRAVRKALAVVGTYDPRFAKCELRSVETSSGVGIQPIGFKKIFAGAETRAIAALADTHAAVGIGIENGLVRVEGCWFDPPGVVIVDAVRHVRGRSLGAFLPIPAAMVREVRKERTELGVVIQRRAGGGEKDPHKHLSRGMLDRESIIVGALLAAFVQIINPDEYFPSLTRW